MIAFLADENFNRNIVRGLSRRSSLDILIAKEVGLTGADDAGVLAWAGERGRIVLTHDAATMPAAAFQRLARGLPMPGLLRIRTTLPVAEAIEERLLIAECSRPEEWDGVVRYLPL